MIGRATTLCWALSSEISKLSLAGKRFMYLPWAWCALPAAKSIAQIECDGVLQSTFRHAGLLPARDSNTRYQTGQRTSINHSCTVFTSLKPGVQLGVFARKFFFSFFEKRTTPKHRGFLLSSYSVLRAKIDALNTSDALDALCSMVCMAS